jgi:starvation-inducible DNA-binding protein
MTPLITENVSKPNVAVYAEEKPAVMHALSGLLASTFILYQKTLFYHWNVTGPNFFALHKTFEEHYQALQQAADDIAERIRALGYFSPGTAGEFQRLSSIREDSLPENERKMVENLLNDHKSCSAEAAQVFAAAENMRDQATMDLMIRRITFHDKTAWMLHSFLEQNQ